jgi:hypothetical protein
MTSDDREVSPTGTDEERPGLGRRRLLRNIAGLGVAGVAGGLLVGTTTASASASQAAVPAGPTADGPVVAHVHDLRTGQVELLTGDRQVIVHNPVLAQALARAAASH